MLETSRRLNIGQNKTRRNILLRPRRAQPHTSKPCLAGSPASAHEPIAYNQEGGILRYRLDSSSRLLSVGRQAALAILENLIPTPDFPACSFQGDHVLQDAGVKSRSNQVKFL